MKVSRANPAIREALKLSFPDYTGRTIRVEPYQRPRTFDLYWSGGTRDELVLLDYANGRVGALKVEGAPWSNAKAFEPIDQPPGTVLAIHTIFCGHDLGVTFQVRPAEGQIGAGALALAAGQA